MHTDNGPVIVALDGSKNAENAIPVGVFLANAYGCELHLIHVVTDEERPRGDNPAEAVAIFEKYAADQMANYHADNGYLAIAVHGEAAATVTQMASDSSAKVVVLATHGQGGFRASVIGSVADKICRSATTPIVAVPAIDGVVTPGAGPVVVGLDGSHSALVALATGRTLAEKLGTRVVLVRACTTPVIAGPEYVYYPPSAFTDIEESAKAYLAEIAHPDEVQLVGHGLASEVLNEAAAEQNASFIVVAAHGKGALRRMFLGSTSNDLLHSLSRPVVIVPERPC